VSSQTNVKSFVYNATGKILSVTYNSGSIWEYHSISPEDYAKLAVDDNLSRSIHALVRQGTIVGRLVNAKQ
jgi:hypothetical protein